MTTRIKVQVSAATLTDARHEQSANFLPCISGLLSDGYTVEIETANGTAAFDSANNFTVWFMGLVDRLATLHYQLEAKGNQGEDWAAARNLEDTLGSGQATTGQISKAEALLAKYNG